MRSIRNYALFAAAGPVSILLIKIFSELALADIPKAPALSAPAESLGIYRVTDIEEKSRSHTGSLCGDTSERSQDCGMFVWVVRNEDQIALLDPAPIGNQFYSRFLHGRTPSAKCNDRVLIKTAKQRLFKSDFCRAEKLSSSDTALEEAFYFQKYRDSIHDGMAHAAASAAENLAVGLPAGMASSQIVFLPKGVSVPSRLRVLQTTHMVLLGFSATNQRTYVLSRMSD